MSLNDMMSDDNTVLIQVRVTLKIDVNHSALFLIEVYIIFNVEQ